MMHILPTLAERIEMAPRLQARYAARKARLKSHGLLRKVARVLLGTAFWSVLALFVVDSFTKAKSLDDFLGSFLTSPFGFLSILLAGYFVFFWRVELLVRRVCRKLTGSTFNARAVYDEEYSRLTSDLIPKRKLRRPVTPRRRRRSVACPAAWDLGRN